MVEPGTNTVEPIEIVLNLWHQGIGAAEIGRRFGRSRDWTRGVVRRAAEGGDAGLDRTEAETSSGQRPDYQPKTRRFYHEKEKQSGL